MSIICHHWRNPPRTSSIKPSRKVVLRATELSFACRLDPVPAQVGHAREQVRKVIPGWGLAEYDDLLELLVSELVTNALAHCHGPIDLRLSYSGNDLWIEVHDSGDETPVRRDPGQDDESGRGLMLIDRLIEMHGGIRGIARQTSRDGKTVYVALSLPPLLGAW
jgi:signal transduction histidine kinase